MHESSIITMTTDFGVGSPYVAEMKGAMLSIDPSLGLVDVTHGIKPQDVFEAALVMRQVGNVFPPGTVHLVVVDPGVGSERDILAVSSEDRLYVAPNNGVLTFAIQNADYVGRVDEPRFWRSPVSSTFHGRDIMGPVAAQLSLGVGLDLVSSLLPQSAVQLDVTEPVTESNQVRGQVLCADSFGNLITNIRRHDVLQLWSGDAAEPTTIGTSKNTAIEIRGRLLSLVSTYAEGCPGELVALFGSGDFLEVAVCSGNAAELLGEALGESVLVKCVA